MSDKQLSLKNEATIQNSAGDLLRLALEKDIDTDKLEKLIDLKNKEEARFCKKEFDSHFTEMQKEFTPIDRSKEGYQFKYAPLSIMQNKYNPIITKHGFAYRWKESAIDTGGKRITIIISGHGHSDDSTFFDIPILEATKSQNSIQVAGAMSTYGQRYTFKAGFGITETDEDTDGNLNYEDGIQYAEDIKIIRACKTKDDLVKVFKTLYTKYENDKIGRAVIGKEKDKMKAVFK